MRKQGLSPPDPADTTLPGSGGLYLFRVNVKVRDLIDYFGMCTDPKRIRLRVGIFLLYPCHTPLQIGCTPPNAARAVRSSSLTQAGTPAWSHAGPQRAATHRSCRDASSSSNRYTSKFEPGKMDVRHVGEWMYPGERGDFG